MHMKPRITETNSLRRPYWFENMSYLEREARLIYDRMDEEELDTGELIRICREGDANLLRSFIAVHRGRDIDFAVVDKVGWGPLHLAVENRSLECLEMLLASKSVDIYQQNIMTETCLDVAMRSVRYAYRAPSCEIVQLILEKDPTFQLIKKNDLSVLVQAIKNDQIDAIKTIISTLQRMHFSFPKSFDSLRVLMIVIDHVPHTRDPDWFWVMESLLVFAEPTANDFLPRMYRAVCYGAYMNSCKTYLGQYLHKWHQIRLAAKFDLCINRWHLAESNLHCGLVTKLLDTPEFSFANHLIFGLHSDIQHLFADLDELTEHFYEGIIQDLLKVDVSNRPIVNEVLNILWPKIDWLLFSTAFANVLHQLAKNPYDQSNQGLVDKLTCIKWLHDTRIGPKLDIELMTIRNARDAVAIVKALMPFSTESTADGYLTHIHNEFYCGRLDAMRESLRLDASLPETSLNMQAIYNCDELAKYCMEGDHYREMNNFNIKNLCRFEVRKHLLKIQPNGAKMSHAEFVQKIRELGVPPKIQRFLLFNDTEYNCCEQCGDDESTR